VIPEDALAVVDVVDERVERPNPLLQAALDPRPFLGADDSRDQVERERALRAGRVAVEAYRVPASLDLLNQATAVCA
jgi:hypothetical protein